jgi:hypothetical protein
MSIVCEIYTVSQRKCSCTDSFVVKKAGLTVFQHRLFFRVINTVPYAVKCSSAQPGILMKTSKKERQHVVFIAWFRADQWSETGGASSWPPWEIIILLWCPSKVTSTNILRDTVN